ncbi:MAG TPA: hypothetical protein V6D33_08905 [Cyanophyceae cyanobacterium]
MPIVNSSLSRPLPGMQIRLIARQPLTPIAVSPLPNSPGETAIISVTSTTLGASQPTSIEIAGHTYYPYPEPVPGTFTWNPQTQQATIQLVNAPALSEVEGGVDVVTKGSPSYENNYLPPPYPELFTRFPLQGSFSWTETWEGHPSGSFSFVTWAHLKEAIAQFLAKGTELTFWGVGFRVSSLTITEQSASEKPQRLISVQVGLGGKHENYTDRIVPWHLQTTSQGSSDEIDPECLSQLTPAQQTQLTKTTKTTVAEIARRAGTAFSGPSMSVEIPKEASPSEGTTFLTEAQKWLDVKGVFLDFSNPNAVVARGLRNFTSYYFTEKDIRGEVSCSVNGDKTQVSGVGYEAPGSLSLALSLLANPTPPSPLVPRSENIYAYPWASTYDPRRKLTGEFLLEDAANQEDTQDNGEYQEPRWRRREPVRQTIISGDPEPNRPPVDMDRLKDLSVCFDLSGTVSKTKRIEVVEDGVTMSISEERWGAAFYGEQMYDQEGNLIGALPGASWRKVRNVTTTTLVDEQTNYLLGSDSVGWELDRPLKEDLNDPSKSTLALDKTDEIEGKLYRALQFFQNPYYAHERNYLEPLNEYYKDVEPPPLLTYKACLPSGRSEIRYKEDPTWVDPYFCLIKTTQENSFQAIRHPEDTADAPVPPLTTGRDTWDREMLNILPSKNTKSTIGFIGSQPKSFALSSIFNLDKVEDAYISFKSTYSAQNSNWNSIELTDFTRNSGQPSIHQRKPPLLEREEPNKNTKEQKDEEAAGYDHYLYSGVDNYYSNNVVEGGTLEFPKAKTLSQAIQAARNALTKENIKNSMTESVTLNFLRSREVKAGYVITYVCNGVSRKRRVLSVSRTVKVDSLHGRPIVLFDDAQFSLGLEREAPVHHTRKTKPKPTTNRENQKAQINRLFIPAHQPLGESLGNWQSRRNIKNIKS